MAHGDLTREEVQGEVSVDTSSEFKHILVTVNLIVSEEGPDGETTELTRDDGMVRILYPHNDVSGETQNIQDLAAANWTDAIKESWEIMRVELGHS